MRGNSDFFWFVFLNCIYLCKQSMLDSGGKHAIAGTWVLIQKRRNYDAKGSE